MLLAQYYMPSAEGNPGMSSSNTAVDMQVASMYQETLGSPPPGYGNARMPWVVDMLRDLWHWRILHLCT